MGLLIFMYYKKLSRTPFYTQVGLGNYFKKWYNEKNCYLMERIHETRFYYR